VTEKTVEQKLYEAYRRCKPVSLTANDVLHLLYLDDALRARITNAACQEAGVDEAGVDEAGVDRLNGDPMPTWEQFVESLRDGSKPSITDNPSPAAK
jgi:hypothetical protein